MGIPVKLQAFEGPLDLLLHLIDKNKVDIYDIPITEITDQYLLYVQGMDVEDLNVVSEFLVMAASLIDIKSRMLLPKQVDEDGQDIDPRQELVEQLIQHKLYRYMAIELKEKLQYSGKAMYKPPTVPKEVAKYEPAIDMDNLLKDISLEKLNNIFLIVLRRQEDKVDKVRAGFGKIEKEGVSLPEKITYVRNYAKEYKQFSFSKLLEMQNGKMELIVTFLAVLELMKIGKINIVQKHIFDDILISST